MIRINKYLSEAGYCSRRQADKLVEAGLVIVNGELAVNGTKVTDKDHITVNGEDIVAKRDFVYMAFNKPVGITCTTDKKIKGNIINYINYPERIFHVGRLDKPSQGLIIMTNDGDIVNKILRSRNNHEKEYIVKVDNPVDGFFIKEMSNGVPILDRVTKKCLVEQISEFEFRIILTEGLNRQIRRMCEYFGYQVVKLERIRIMNIELDVPVGKWRYLTEKELMDLNKLTEVSEKTHLEI